MISDFADGLRAIAFPLSNNSEQVIIVPSSLQAPGTDITFGGLLILEQIQNDVAQDGQVFSGVILANSALIFPKGNVLNPMHLIFDFPMTAFGLQNRFRFGRQTGNEITGLHFDGFPDLSLRNHPNHALQTFPWLAFPTAEIPVRQQGAQLGT